MQVSSTASPSFAAGNSGNSGSGSSGVAGAGAVGSVELRRRRQLGHGGHSPAAPAPAAELLRRHDRREHPAGSSTGGGQPGVAPPRRRRRSIAPAFKGIGAALVLLGLLAAAALAYAYKRADDATEVLGTACADGDPLMERFTASADDLTDFGGAN